MCSRAGSDSASGLSTQGGKTIFHKRSNPEPFSREELHLFTEPERDRYPLSPIQHAMLVESLATPGSRVGIWQLLWSLEEDIELAPFAEAWRGALKRHSILRTRILSEELAEPLQEVSQNVRMDFAAADWSRLAAAEQQRQQERFLAADRRRGLSLERAPLLRVTVFRFAADHHLAVVTVHHAIFDGRTLMALVKEIFVAYEARQRGELPRLPEARPYRSYIEWLASLDRRPAERFWRRALHGIDTPSRLEIARPENADANGERPVAHGDIKIRLAPAATAELVELARRYEVTVNTLLLGAWALMLARYGERNDVVFGVVRTNRSIVPDGGSILGPMMSSMPFRATLRPDSTLEEHLSGVRQHWLDMRQADFASTAEIRSWSTMPPELPLFESLVIYEKHELTDLLRQQGGAWLGRSFRYVRQPRVPLNVYGYQGERLELKIIYDRGRFYDTAIWRMLGQLRHLLEAMPSAGQRRLADLPVLSPGERHQVLVEWNDVELSSGDEEAEPTIIDAFNEWVEHTPDALAVDFDDGRLTYGELARRARFLARRLRALGVGRETLVVSCMERSAARAVGLVGILESGGAYLPLEPSDPADRLAYILGDCGAAAVLVDAADRERMEGLCERAAAAEPLRVLSVEAVDEREGDGREVDGREVDESPHPRQIAYVIYTSGSTGRPKGTAIQHQAAVRLVRDNRYLEISPGDRFAQVNNTAFDAAALEMWAALLNGAVMAGIPRQVAAEPEAMASALRERRIDSILFVTPLFHLLADHRPEAFGSLRTALVGGEAMDPRRVRAIPDGEMPEHLLNCYGPTEGTICTTTFRADTVPDGVAAMPIGRPIDETSVHVVDRFLQAVPIGVAGELTIGGPRLARGYLGRPRLTAERFRPDPFSALLGERLYRTGDLVRHRADGVLDFLGRIDHQIKLRGFRIELGEIEAVLAQHPAVREAVVVLHEAAGGSERHLAAYLSVHGPDHDPSEQVREHARRQLPDYMVPSFFVSLDDFPRLPSGKLDRARLPAPEVRGRDFEAPRDETEEKLAAIWGEELGVEQVGRRDDFFALGGNSLSAVRILSRIRRELEIELSLAALFEHHVLDGLARHLRRVLAPPEAEPAAPAGTVDVAPTPLASFAQTSFAQQRLWLLQNLDPGSTAYNVPFAVELEGDPETALLAAALADVARRHPPLETAFAADATGEPVARRVPLPELLRVDLGSLPVDRREALAQRLGHREARRAFALERGAARFVLLLCVGEERHRLLALLHHIAFDGGSIPIFLREVAAAYGARHAGRRPGWPELATSYADYAAGERRRLDEVRLRSLLDFWRARLARPPVLELPTDRPHPAVPSFAGAWHRFDLPPAVGRAADRLQRRFGVSSMMVFAAAWSAWLARLSGQSDIIFGLPVAGRGEKELQALIGFFVKTLVLRPRVGDGTTLADLLGASRGALIEALEHQDLPFDLLVQEILPQRDPRRHPIFQSALVLQDDEPPAASAAGLRFRFGGAYELGDAKFDLMLSLYPQGDESLRGIFEYRTELFDSSTIRRFEKHSRRLFKAALERPRRPLASLDLLGEAERHQVLAEWSDAHPGTPAPRHTIPELFAHQAIRRPASPALINGERVLEYGELARRVRALAAVLRRAGVGAEVPVGVALERSAEMVVAILAVLEAGGWYLPLQPELPLRRLAFLLEDVAPALVITSEPHRATLEQAAAADSPIELLALESVDFEGPPGTRRDDSRRAELSPDQLAYTMYTSGSTGTPKGVSVSHRSVVRLVRDNPLLPLSGDDVGLLLAPAAFDASTLEVWGPLLNGGRLVVAPAGNPTLEELGQVIRERRITLLWLTAGLFHQMVDRQLESLRGVRQLFAGGDVLSPAHVERALEELPNTTLINGYGPTENTTFTCCHRMAGGTARRWQGAVPLGRPIGRTRVRILDAGLRPQPVGVVGELCAGGDGLARGYAGRPAITAERFIPDPQGAAGERLYRTGDRARFLRDGIVDFLGRADQQVKIRGHRVEVGEVEAALEALPEVAQAAVLATGEGAEARRLAAFVVAAGETTAQALRDALRQRLPEPLVPSAWTLLAELPLTPNGKLDRRALEALSESEVASGEDGAPRSAEEKKMAAIWAEVLDLDAVPIDADFFLLGGHSLLATRLISRVRESFDVELPLGAIFEAPTVEALLGRLGGVERADEPLLPTARREADRQPDGSWWAPLSFAQQRLWFLDRFEPGSPLYNIPGGLHLAGDLSPAALFAALSALAARHESLRTTFVSAGDEPRQRIVPASQAPVHLAEVELRGLPAARQRDAARRLLARGALHPFDLEAGPLWRASLVRLAEDRAWLAVEMHHIVSDGASLEIFYRELVELYEAALAGRTPGLPELAVSYGDFAAWQKRWLEGQRQERQLEYWHREMAGVPAALELPTDHPRPRRRRHAGGGVEVTLPIEPARIEAWSRQRDATVFMTLLAAHQALLFRLTGQGDVVVGSPIAHRGRREIENLIGFFVNMLALRGRAARRDSFADLLAKTRRAALDAYEHQDLPFERLVEHLGIERDLDTTPLFQTTFAFDRESSGEVRGEAVSVRPLTAPIQVAHFDLMLALRPRQDQIRGHFLYRRDLFETTTIKRWRGHLAALLVAALEDPARPVEQLPLLAPAQRHQLLWGWNDTESAWPRRTVDAVFAETARRHPDAVAVASADGRWSYAELDRRARLVAARLRELGVGTEDVVGVFAPRSPELLAALAGVLYTGAAYAPLDPEYPAERLAFMIEDCGARVILADPRLAAPELAERLPAGTARIVHLDAGLETGEAAAELGLPMPSEDPERLAYVMYTSGSTGRPKGVAVCHRSILRLVMGSDFVRLGPDEIHLLLAPVSFDAATFEIWGALLNGARLELAPPGPLALGELAGVLRERRISTLWLTAGLFHRLVEDQPTALSGVRQLLAGGDVLSPPHVHRALSQMPANGVLVNGYGPTENTTFTCCHGLRPGWDGSGAVPIGRPIATTAVRLLDAAFELAPPGVVGELWAAGAGLTRGYFRRPRATSERFVPDPFASEPGQRLYRTGDLACWRTDATLDFLGRSDTQVKVRGFRIELGEIETVLAALPEIHETVVVARQEGPGDQRLVAYVVSDGELDRHRIERRLAARLPAHMLPAAYVALDRLPLDANGKVDRRALPAPLWDALSDRFGAPPSTPSEKLLAKIWREVLGLEELSVDDDFFALGGHSLLATRVMTRIRQSFGIEIPLAELFETPALGDLAARIDEEQATAGDEAPAEELPPVEASGGEPGGETPAPLSFAQDRLFILSRLDPEASRAFHVLYAVELDGELGRAALDAAFAQVHQRHSVLRSHFPMIEGLMIEGESGVRQMESGARQAVEPFDAERFRAPLIDLGALPAAAREIEARRLRQAELERPFDLENGPVTRRNLLRLAPRRHAMLFVLHHIVADGWSMSLLLGEAAAEYRGRLLGSGPVAPPPAVQYSDYAVWQRRWLSEERIAARLDFWRRQLDGAPEILDLPTDRPRPAVRSWRGGAAPINVDPSTTDRLEDLAAANRGATPFMVLLAAFQALLARLSGQNRVVVGSPAADRRRLELENSIGFFVNLLPLDVEVDSRQSFAELVEQVRRRALHAQNHQDLPFERLVAALRPERDPAHTPIFQTLFVWQDQAPAALELPGISARLLSVEKRRTQFDLTLALWRDEDGLGGQLEYASDLFDGTTARRWAGHFGLLLEAASEEPGRRLAAISLLSPAELQQIREWNSAPRDAPCYAAAAPDDTLDSLITARARRAPDAPAVIFEALDGTVRRLSYAELDRRSAALASRLRVSGVSAESLVGVALRRSPEMVIAVLGVMRAGGAYLPVDPDYPPERISHMVEDSGLEVMITDDSAASGSEPPLPGLKRIRLGALERAVAEAEESAATGVMDLERMAYLIYTSGSTGRPKGVAVSQRSATAFCVEFRRRLDLRSDDRFFMFALPSFDASVEALFPTLIAGAALVLHEAPGRLTGNEFGAFCRRHEPSLMDIPVVFWLPWLEEIEKDPGACPLPSLERVILGGEGIPLPALRRWARVTGGRIPVWGPYGITETTVTTTLYRSLDGRELAPEVARLPIGRPLFGARVTLTDPWLAPVPIGVAGELWIGGRGVARGYHGRPADTARRFLPDPWSGQPGARVYRSGDLGRFRPGGELEFLGRADDQVKIRGFRVEPGEIAAVLAQQPEVVEAEVLARGENGRQRLVAYVVAQPQAQPSGDRWRRALERELPAHMVPTAFVVLDEMPTTPHGKLDRHALAELPLPEETSADAVAPRDKIERALAEAWKSVLRLDELGIHDNFFGLGGDSIASIGVANHLRHAGLKLGPQQIFEHQTIAELAPEVELLVPGSPTLDAVAATGEVPLTPIQHWFFELDEPEPAHWNQSFLFIPNRPLDPRFLRRIVNAWPRIHDALRLRFEPRDGSWHQTSLPPEEAPLDLAVADFSTLPSAHRRPALERASERLQASLDLGAGPIGRAVYFELGHAELSRASQPASQPAPQTANRLLLLFHHLVVDLVSWRILLEDLERGYEELERRGADDHRPLQTPPGTTPFKAWAESLTSLVPEARHEGDVWLSPARASRPALPRDFMGEVALRHAARSLSIRLEPEPTEALVEELAAAYRMGVDGVLLAALLYAFHRLTGERVMLVELESHGREESAVPGAELSRTVGWFTTNHPLLLELSDDTPQELLRTVKETLARIPRNGLGHGLLRHLDRGGLAGELAAQPRAEIAFNYLGRLDGLAGGFLQPAPESPGSQLGPRGHRHHLLEVSAFLRGGELQVRWTYSPTIHRRSTIAGLAEDFRAALERLIEHGRSDAAGDFTPSDFGTAQLDQEEIDNVMDLLQDLDEPGH